MLISPTDIIQHVFRETMSGVAETSLRHMEIVWSILAILSLGALAFLFDSMRLSLAVLKQASAGHHMLTIRGDRQPLSVNKEVEYR